MVLHGYLPYGTTKRPNVRGRRSKCYAECVDMFIEYVNKKPEKFQMGVIYILQTPNGRPDYIYTYQVEGS